jgi:hypothetical protein
VNVAHTVKWRAVELTHDQIRAVELRKLADFFAGRKEHAAAMTFAERTAILRQEVEKHRSEAVRAACDDRSSMSTCQITNVIESAERAARLKVYIDPTFGESIVDRILRDAASEHFVDDVSHLEPVNP